MNKDIVQILEGSEKWNLDLYIWDYKHLDKTFKKYEYKIVYVDPLILIDSIQGSIDNNNNLAYVFHYMAVISIKIKHRINITINKSFQP